MGRAVEIDAENRKELEGIDSHDQKVINEGRKDLSRESSTMFEFVGEEIQQTDVSQYQEIEVELEGGGGGGATSKDYNEPYSGGDGGYVKALLDVSDIDTLHMYVGEGGDAANNGGQGGWGRSSGGDGGYDNSWTLDDEYWGGAGGGSTEIVGEKSDGTQVWLAAADGGGGGGSFYDGWVGDYDYGGGGGGAGGSAGSHDQGTDPEDGDPAQSPRPSGSGEGGNGGSDSPGGSGGYAVNNGYTLEPPTGSQGGADNGGAPDTNGGNGNIGITYYEYDVDVAAPKDQNEQSSGEKTYEFSVTNTGDKDDTYDLSANAPQSGWSASPQQSAVTVAAGTNETVKVDVVIPGDAGGESSEVELEGASQSYSIVDSDNMTVTLEEDFGVVVTAPQDQTESSSGTYTYSYEVENAGNTEDTYDLTASASKSGWSATSQRSTVTVAVGGSEVVDVEVVIPGDAGGESSEVELEAISQGDPAVTDSDFMGVTLQEDFGV
ncbi:MAG: hypothetical protein V5A88_08040, partial [Candidatus Thermoplasmatota archaeon]